MFSSQQWFSLLDSLLEDAVGSLLSGTRMMEHYVSQLMLFQLANKKRHVSIIHDWKAVLGLMAVFVSRPSMSSFRDMALDRGYVEAALRDFADATEGYEREYARQLAKTHESMLAGYVPGESESIRIGDYHARVLAREKDIFHCVVNVRRQLSRVAAFKRKLTSNYLGYMHKTANATSDRDDLAQDYYLAANKAMDHFHAGKGTFKSYLDIWMRKAAAKRKEDAVADAASRVDMEEAEFFVENAGMFDEDPVEDRVGVEQLKEAIEAVNTDTSKRRHRYGQE